MGAYHTSNTPPTGWLADSGVLQPDMTVGGFWARKQRIHGLCGTKDCRRRCEVDCENLVGRGLGRLSITDVKALLRCHRLGGCSIDFQVDRDGGQLPLRSLLGLSYVRIRFVCRSCGFFRVATPDAVIKKLKEKGRGGEQTSTTDIAATIKEPCKQCKNVAWEVQVLWPNEASAGFRQGRIAP